MMKTYNMKTQSFIISAARSVCAVLVLLAGLGNYAFAATFDLSDCSIGSSFARVTQSEGPTYACGGLDLGGGNPINLLNGNKYEAALDFASSAIEPELKFARYYNSQSNAKTSLGHGWYSSFDIKLYDTDELIQVREATGKRINFYMVRREVQGSPELFEVVGLSENPEDGFIQRKIDGSGWVWESRNRGTYTFSRGAKDTADPKLGLLRSIKFDQGTHAAWKLDLHYDTEDRLVRAINAKKNSVAFEYSQTKHNLPKVTLKTPAGNFYYFLDARGNLSQVLTASGDWIGYEYDSEHNLTAKKLYNPQTKKHELMSFWRYDSQGRAVLSSQAGGVNRVSVSFDPKLSGDPSAVLVGMVSETYQNTVTNSLGQTSTYKFRLYGGQYQLLETKGAGCSTCGPMNRRYTYNNFGKVTLTQTLDASGLPLSASETVYDDQGRPEASYGLVYEGGLLASRTLAQKLDYAGTKSLLPEKVSMPSVYSGHEHSFQYSYEQIQTATKPVRVIESGFTPSGAHLRRTTRFGYNTKGQLIWENGPLPDHFPSRPKSGYKPKDLSQTDVVLYTYSETGDLASIWEPRFDRLTRLQSNQEGKTTQIFRSRGQDTLRFDFTYRDDTLIGMTRSVNEGAPEGVTYDYEYQGKPSTVSDLSGNLIQANGHDSAGRIRALLTRTGVSFRHLNTEGELESLELLSGSGSELYRSRLQVLNQDEPLQKTLAALVPAKKNPVTQTSTTSEQPVTAFTPLADNKLLSVPLTSGLRSGDGLAGVNLRADGSLSAQEFDPLTGELSDLYASALVGVSPKVTTQRFEQGRYTLSQSGGNTTTYLQDDFGRIAQIDSAQAGQTVYFYDPANRLTGIDVSGVSQIRYELDYQDRRTHKSTNYLNNSAAKPYEVTWSYDGDRLVAAEETNQTQTLDYDDSGNLVAKHVTYPGLATLTTTYSYSKDGQLKTTTLPNGTRLFSRGASLRYKTEGSWLSKPMLKSLDPTTENGMDYQRLQVGSSVIMSKGYAQGQYSGLQYQLKDSWNVPFINTAHAAAGNQLFGQAWRRGANGLLAEVTETSGEGAPFSESYLYSDYGHIIDATKSSQESPTRFAFDPVGNRLIEDNQGELKTYRYDAAGRLSEVARPDMSEPTLSIDYTAQGLPTTYGDFVFGYTGTRLTEVKDRTGKLLATYRYNDAGQRIQKTTYSERHGSGSAQSTYFTYQGSDVEHELNDQGQIQRSYVYAGADLVGLFDQESNETDKNRASDQSVSSVFYPVVTDYLGRPRQVLNNQGKVLWSLAPDLYGGMAQPRGKNLNLRFPGQYEDPETQLYYNHYRYYDPATGRYLTPDPLGLSGGENLYAYVNAAPTHYIDPPGLLLFAFDGTGNRDYGIPGQNLSNVVKFRNAYVKPEGEPVFPDTRWSGQARKFDSAWANQNAFYIAGAGTEDKYTNIGSNGPSNILDSGIGNSLPYRVDQMLIYFTDYIGKVIKQREANKTPVTKKTKITIDTIGFSRGAASARLFASKVEKLLNQDYSGYFDELLYPNYQRSWPTEMYAWKKRNLKDLLDCHGIKIEYGFMGLWDSVPSFGPLDISNDVDEYSGRDMSLTVTSAFKTVAHAVAVNEHREKFMPRSIYSNPEIAISLNGKPLKDGKRRIERGFMGAHSDIGGGYSEGDLSDATLMWMIKEAQASGVRFDVARQITAKGYDTITNPIVHDSVGVPIAGDAFRFAPGRNFLYNDSTDQGKSMFENQRHLGLNWEGTLEFENSGPFAKNKFSKIKSLTERFQATTTCTRVQQRNGACRFHILNDYYELKDEDAGEDKTQTILYGTSDRERIKINNYVNWLKSNYGLTNLKAGS